MGLVDFVYHGSNVIVALCYYAIAALIITGLVRERQLFRNALATATGGIFLTCALGHSLHAVGSHIARLDPTVGGGVPVLMVSYINASGLQAAVDALTIVPAVAFLALRRRYGLVIRGPHAILRFEQQLAAKDEQMQAMREVERLKDQFMAMVSHELRTPLTSIIGYSDLMLKELHGPLTARQEQHQRAVRVSAQRLLGLINDLLDVAKLDAGALTIAPRHLDLGAAIDRAALSVRPLVSAGGLELRREQPDDLPPVLADPDRLEQMLVNLLANAVKFTPRGGTITISARLAGSADGTAANGAAANGATSDGSLPPARVVVCVSDTGQGIPAEHRAHIWDRFYQADSSATRRYGGTGLGLAIVKQLAELHGGRAWVESGGKGNGARFYFTLAVAPAVDAAEAAPIAVPEGAGPLVLVASGDVDTREILTALLASEGYRVAPAASGGVALAVAEQRQPVAVLLDPRLPEGDGWSVLARLQRAAATRGLPVVVLADGDDGQYALAHGAVAALPQPVPPDRLRAVLQRLTQDALRASPGVLLVEPEPLLADAVRRQLEDARYAVTIVDHGGAALAAALRCAPGLVLLDLALPDGDGLSVLRELRAHPATREVAVVALAAHELTEGERHLLDRDAQAVITRGAKPQALLLAEIDAAVEQWRAQALVAPRRTVLIVDDEPRVRELARTVVEELLGQQVLVAADGQEGLQLARTHRPDLVLLDMMMPHLNGFEVVRQLRADPATAGLVVLAFTAASGEDRVEALLAGCDGCIAKPFDTDALVARLRASLGLAEPIGPR